LAQFEMNFSECTASVAHNGPRLSAEYCPLLPAQLRGQLAGVGRRRVGRRHRVDHPAQLGPDLSLQAEVSVLTVARFFISRARGWVRPQRLFGLSAGPFWRRGDRTHCRARTPMGFYDLPRRLPFRQRPSGAYTPRSARLYAAPTIMLSFRQRLTPADVKTYPATILFRCAKKRLLVQRLGREPGPEEIAEHMEMPLDKVQQALKIVKEPISLETPLGDEEQSSLGDFVEDQETPSPVEAAIQGNLGELMRKVLATLTPREEQIVRMRFGIGQKAECTLEEVGKLFTITRERIRQIEAKAMGKLRQAGRSRSIESFLECE
jgi:DNA-directed RNA polymerase specialized sigma24 family protein